MGADDDVFHDVPQARGKAVHKTIDEQTYSSRKDILTGISVFSDELGICGKIDIYNVAQKALIERKYQLKTIYQGQLYQLWAQYFCMIEMGYEIEKLSLYAISENKTFQQALPTIAQKQELQQFIESFKTFNPEYEISINSNKCAHCIYSNLCDKTP